MHTLISSDALAAHLADPDLIIFDASFYLPHENRDPLALFHQKHIPGALFFDIDDVSDHQSSIPHMAPDPVTFERMIGDFGVSNSSKIVAYDQRGLFSAARVWWLFRLFGHDRVQVLDGGLPKWLAEHRPIESGHAPAKREAHFTARLNPAFVRSIAQVKANLDIQSEIVIDARSADRFSGAAPEPRPGVRSGHVPGARSLPFGELLNPDGTLKSSDALRTIFNAIGINETVAPVTMCGSGVTGTVVSLALVHAGLPPGALYDGSWAEWGGSPDTQVEKSV